MKRKRVVKELDHMIEKMVAIYSKYAEEIPDEPQADLKAMSEIIMKAHETKDRFRTRVEIDAEFEKYDD